MKQALKETVTDLGLGSRSPPPCARGAILDHSGRIVASNGDWCDIERRSGWTATSDLGSSYLDVCDSAGEEPGARQAAEGIRALLGGRRDPVTFDYPMGDRWFTFTATAFIGEGPARVGVTHMDVTEYRSLEAEAHAQSAVLDQFEVAVVRTDKNRRITRWSVGAEQLYGWSESEALGQQVRDLIAPQPVVVSEGHRSVVEGRYELSRKDGSRFVAQVRWTKLHDSAGQFAGALGIAMNVSAQDRAEETATALRSRLLAVTDSMREGLFALDPEGGVTWMNRAAADLLGWSLDEIKGQRLHDLTRHQRSDGLVHDPEECPLGAIGSRTSGLQVDDEDFQCRDGTALAVSYSVNPLKTAHGLDGCVLVFMDATHVRAEQERLNREIDAVERIQRVQAAVEENRLLLYAQPIVDLATMSVIQHELLLRVAERDGAISLPGDYLATAEEFDLIGDIDRWVVRKAIDLAAAGQTVEVNVSAPSASDPQMLTDIEQWLVASGADPDLLVFELTETAMISSEQSVKRFVDRIHQLGCKLALDDFGTGYSGFGYLKQLPVDYLKIDVEFVRDLRANSASRYVIEAVVSLAQGFGLNTVAEGVEDAETLELLIALGVDFAQGYHLGRPAPMRPTSSIDTKGQP